jgi:hypothetical protein
LLLLGSVWDLHCSLEQPVTSRTARPVESEKTTSRAVHHMIGAARLLQLKLAQRWSTSRALASWTARC